MKIIDWYIIKKFLGTFFYAISLIILIVIVFDISEKIDEFIAKEAPLNEIIFTYYLNFIPYFVNLFSPLFTFIAVIFFTSRLAANTEIVAMLGGGISFYRLLRPFLLSAIFLALFSFYLANFVIPHANKVRRAFHDVYVDSYKKSKDRNIHIQYADNKYAYIETYNRNTDVGVRFSLEYFNDANQLVYKLSAQYLKWDSVAKNWIAEEYFIRHIDGLKENIERGKSLTLSFDLTPSDFIIFRENWETMRFWELRDFINELKLKGAKEVRFYVVEKHRRISFPFATIILTLIGLSLSSRKLRGGTGMHIGMGLLLSFTYILFMQVATVFSTSGNLDPFIAVWIPNIIFGALAAYLLRIAPK